jgi:hypothetical protein
LSKFDRRDQFSLAVIMAAIILPIGVGWKFTRAANNIRIYGVPANGMGISGSANTFQYDAKYCRECRVCSQ